MAKLECELQGDFSLILSQLEDEIINGSISASLEEKSDFCSGSAYCIPPAESSPATHRNAS